VDADVPSIYSDAVVRPARTESHDERSGSAD
jgi:hypothetical protein